MDGLSGLIFIKQVAFNPESPDHIVRFGPLASTISTLMAEGFHLQCISKRAWPRHTIQLVRGRERYTLCKIRTEKLLGAPDLQTIAMQRRPSQQIVSTDSAADLLLLEHPRVERPTRINRVGNQTLSEFLFSDKVPA